MAVTKLYHGSNQIVQAPSLAQGKDNNDYGRGFYCTELPEMAREWACKENKDGFVNEYEFRTDGLRILNLLDGKHNVLNWIALLLKNRTFTLQDEIAVDARNYIIEQYSVDLTEYDVVVGYRADDSYFSYAQSFVANALPLRSLSRALKLGKLGAQTVLVSERAFAQIKFVGAEPISKDVYYPMFVARDTTARTTYRDEIKKSRSYRDDIFVMDILREEMQNDDPRIQRIVLE